MGCGKGSFDIDKGCFRPVLRMAETPLFLLLSRVRRHRAAEFEKWEIWVVAVYAKERDGARKMGGPSLYIMKYEFIKSRDIA